MSSSSGIIAYSTGSNSSIAPKSFASCTSGLT
eukprot:CAMPEP_0195086230 /NCGR_PEP_ID=MMETSP0448-20130528/26425_1 /TAXON_ID=66468 /ORGANISM="Heterocapsa triquestra, Strain CCMP 448" /LENGTH=31 /DNA_ID= /DNA_START= /DNA_END= /DNA_ORIENTATION=